MLKILTTVETESGERIFNFPVQVMTEIEYDKLTEMFTLIQKSLAIADPQFASLGEAVRALEARVSALENDRRRLR